MSSHGRFTAIGVGVGFLVVLIGLLIGGWFLGLALVPHLDATSATLVNLTLALAPAAIVLAKGTRKSLLTALAAIAVLLVALITTTQIHAAVWVTAHLRPGSAERLLTVLSGLVWPILAIGALGAAVSRQTGERFGRTMGLVGTVALQAVHVSVVFALIQLLAGTLPTWLMVLTLVSIGVLLQFVLESEISLLAIRRSSIAVPPSAAKVKSAVETLTKTTVDGPVVVDRKEEMFAEIRGRLFRPPVLVLSAAMAQLDSAPLMAVVAHEFAHASLGHLRMRLWVSIGSLSVLALAVATFAQASGLSNARRPVTTLLVVIVALIGHRLLLHAYMRRQEREADKFATSVAGADAVRAALGITSVGPVIPENFSIWMTHDGLEARRRALEDHLQ